MMPEDIGIIQEVYEKCLDFMLLVDGRAASPESVKEDFNSVPPRKPLDDKYVFGIVNSRRGIVGLLDTLCWYPDQTTWWIDTLLFVPESRSQGLGEKVVEGFAQYARASGALAIILGVVDENNNAIKFWGRMSFELVRETEPRQFGNKLYILKIMHRLL